MALLRCTQPIQCLCAHSPSSKSPRSRTRTPSTTRPLSPMCCSNNHDARIAAELRAQTMKHRVSGLQRAEAMKKSRALLFAALCEHVGLRPDEMSKKWAGLSESDKAECLREFVADWGAPFLPLSLTSVRAMVEDHVYERNPPPRSHQSVSFSVLQRVKDFLAFGND